MVRVGTAQGALVVPPAALVRDGSNPEAADVFVVENGKAARKTVALGVETADAIQVKSGLDRGRRGGPRPADGPRIRVAGGRAERQERQRKGEVTAPCF